MYRDGDEPLTLERPKTLTEAVADQLAEAIVGGALPAGSRLKEIALARELKTSRQTVREALRHLAELGLIEISPHRGALVAEMTPRRAREVISLRAVLEGYAARLAAERGIDDSLLAAMEGALEQQRTAAHTGELMPLVKSDMDFHYRLASYCRHELLLEHLATLQTHTRRLNVSIRQYHAELDEIVNSHLPIIGALRTGDPGEVEAAVRSHVIASGDQLLRRMRERGLVDDET